MAQAGVLYVDHAATGADDGSSWADAYVSLQEALGDAGFGDEIWVTSGKHKPGKWIDINDPLQTTSDPRDATFWLPRGVQMYGGFVGTETAIDQRPASLNQTILSGDIGAMGVDTDNSYRVVFYRAMHGGGYGASDTDQTIPAILDGFRIDGAYADAAIGAGVHAQSVTMGSAIFNTRLWMQDCVISNNYSTDNGGGALLTGWIGNMDGCAVVDNRSDAHGGGVYISQNSGQRFITNSVFSGNSAGQNGGALARQRDSAYPPAQFPLFVLNSKFTGNSADKHGGALSYQTNGSRASSLAVANCEFSGNSAVENGGGVYLGHGTVIMQGGPALVIRGAVGDIQSSTFADNAAGMNGGGVFAGVANDPRADADLAVTNSILWQNAGLGDSQANSIVTMYSSCIDGGGWTSALGNISTDPLFYDGANGDYSLTNGSSAADAGWTPLLPADIADLDGDGDALEALPVDLRGYTRSIDAGVVDAGVGPAPVTDMGAYELCSGDFNRDNMLDFVDVSAFLSAFTLGDPDADINGDGSLDTLDVYAFLTAYTNGC